MGRQRRPCRGVLSFPFKTWDFWETFFFLFFAGNIIHYDLVGKHKLGGGRLKREKGKIQREESKKKKPKKNNGEEPRIPPEGSASDSNCASVQISPHLGEPNTMPPFPPSTSIGYQRLDRGASWLSQHSFWSARPSHPRFVD